MKYIDWKSLASDEEALSYLRSLPRYRNSAFKSLLSRGRFFISLLWCRLCKISKPIFIVLVTNNNCNLKCSYCYGDYGNRSHQENYSTRQLLQIIDELKILGTRLLTIHGGESLLRKDIGEILNYSKLQGFYVSFNTNGYLVPRMIDQLRCVDTVCLSIDGRRENNDRVRGKGCYDKVIEAIEVLNRESMPVVLHATLTRANLEDMDFLAQLAADKHARLQFSILYNCETLKEKFGDLILTDSEIRNTLQKILDLKKSGFPIYYSDTVLEAGIYWPYSYDEKFFALQGEAPKNDHLIPCHHGSLKYQIDADGRVITCWAHDDVDAPNVKTLGVSAALRSCNENDNCRHCAFLANNEHNAFIEISFKSLFNILFIQVRDALKIKKDKSVSDNNAKGA